LGNCLLCSIINFALFHFIQPDSKDYLENPQDYKPSTFFVKDTTFIQQKPDKLLITSDTNKQYIEKNQPYTLPAAKHYAPVLEYILFMIFLSLFSILIIAFFNK